MPSVGETFRAERERRGLTIHQAADGTNIKTDHIRALESGQWSVFGAAVYVRGFARTYAKFLRLDERAVVAEVNAELSREGGLENDLGSDGIRHGVLDQAMLWLSRIKWPVVFPLLLGLILGFAAWTGWKSWQQRSEEGLLPAGGSGLYQPQVSQPGTLPLPTNTAMPQR